MASVTCLHFSSIHMNTYPTFSLQHEHVKFHSTVFQNHTNIKPTPSLYPSKYVLKYIHKCPHLPTTNIKQIKKKPSMHDIHQKQLEIRYHICPLTAERGKKGKKTKVNHLRTHTTHFLHPYNFFTSLLPSYFFIVKNSL